MDVPELLLKHTDGAKLPTPQRFLRRVNLLQHPSLSLRLNSLQSPGRRTCFRWKSTAITLIVVGLIGVVAVAFLAMRRMNA